MIGHHKEGVGSLRPPWEICMHALQHSSPGRSKGKSKFLYMAPPYLDGAKVTASRIGMSSGTEFLFPWLGFLVLVSIT